MPYGTPTPGAGRGKGQQVLVLAIVAGLLFALGGVMTGLYVAKSSEASRNKLELTAQLADRDGKVDANTKEIERLKADLQTANDKVKTVEQDLTGTQNARDEQARQKQVIAKCLDLLTRALAAPNRAAFDKLAKEADKACTEANKYL
jgi:Tfp pilus assembly protein PilN